MASDYISREALLEEIDKAFDESPFEDTTDWMMGRRIVRTFPAANVVDKAEWEKLMCLVEEANKILKSARWISVSERLPKEDEVVLVFGGRSIYTAYYGENRWGGIGWHKLNSKYHNCNPTHWMPLPKPPEEREVQNDTNQSDSCEGG